MSKLPRKFVDIFKTQHTNLELVLLVVAGREAGLALGEAQLGAAEAAVHGAVAARAAGPKPQAVQHGEAGWLAADLDRALSSSLPGGRKILTRFLTFKKTVLYCIMY